MSTMKNRFVGLAASLALLLVVGGIPALLVTLDAVPRVSDFSVDRLTNPDDGTLAVAVIGVVAWLAWLVVAASVAVELVAGVRGIRAPRLPGLTVPQVTAGRLIALAALLFAAVPAGAQSLPASHAATATPHAAAPDPTPKPQHTTPIDDPESARVVSAADERPTTTYTVRRGDSLWKIAEQQLGDGRRYDEIVALNQTVLHGRPDFITPGTVLRIPNPPAPDAGERYVVQPGDTLSTIAAERLSDATAYNRIFEASRNTLQPDGDRLTDPDLIRPGWNLTIPTTDHQPQDAPHHDHQPPAQQPDRPTDETPPPPATESPSGATEPPEAESEAADDDGAETAAWALAGLAGAGAVLAGSLLLVLRQHRRTQLRYRRPGRIIAPPPPELRPVEKTAHLVGTTTAPKIDLLDRALRHLAAACPDIPRVRSVELTDREVTLHLTHPTELPGPWNGADATWARSMDGDHPDAAGELAPYPLLVSVGQSQNGALVLVNLEELRAITVTGDPAASADLGRHISAELSLNPWSVLVEIDTLGIGGELATIDPLRLHHHDDTDTSFLDRLATDLEAETTFEPERFRALVTAGRHADGEAVHKVAKIITSCAGRPGAAVVSIIAEPAADDIKVHITDTGRLMVDALGLDLTAAGLTADEAAACAAIIDVTRDADNAPTPVATESGEGEPLVDQAGALRPEVAEPRPEGPAGTGSLLPLDSATYQREAATTADELNDVAPVVPPRIRAKAADKDPNLDDDLARWIDAHSPVPRLTLLGPVNAHTNGDAKAVARRKPFYVELLAYLTLHPNGVTSSEVCDAFGLKPDRARVDLAYVRRWLGADPRTGEPHLPSARAHSGDDHRGLPIYQVHGVLTDLDLFRRLRTRGQSRGSDGIDDLVAALRLVSGEPFTGLRPAGWSWLLDGDRIDHIMTCAIVDVAHIVTTHALTNEDFDLARLAAETAYRAAPDDETSRLDLVAVAAATGHADLADRQLVDGIFNRSDDDLGPIDLPERTANVVHQRGWDHRGRASKP